VVAWPACFELPAMSEVDDLKARIEQIKSESESKLKQIADQSSAELRKLQESWCAAAAPPCGRGPVPLVPASL
jgi:hypothetical protein